MSERYESGGGEVIAEWVALTLCHAPLQQQAYLSGTIRARDFVTGGSIGGGRDPVIEGQSCVH